MSCPASPHDPEQAHRCGWPERFHAGVSRALDQADLIPNGEGAATQRFLLTMVGVQEDIAAYNAHHDQHIDVGSVMARGMASS